MKRGIGIRHLVRLALIALIALFGCYLVSKAFAQDASPCQPITREQIVDNLPEQWDLPPIVVIFDAEGLSAPQFNPGDLLSETVNQMQEDCDPDETTFPMADTVFSRHPHLLPELPERARRHFIAAEIARSFDAAVALLGPLASAEYDQFVRYRAMVEVLLLNLRQGGGLPAEEVVRLLAAARSTAPSDLEVDPTADLDFIEGIMCIRDGGGFACRQQFDLAIAKDPLFNAARQVRIALLDERLRALTEHPLAAARCEVLIVDVLLDIENILQGLTDNRTIVDVGRSLDRAAGWGSIALLYGAAHAFEEGNAPELARRALEEVESEMERPHPCNAVWETFRDDLSPSLSSSEAR